jgi:hypothetical protein
MKLAKMSRRLLKKPNFMLITQIFFSDRYFHIHLAYLFSLYRVKSLIDFYFKIRPNKPLYPSNIIHCLLSEEYHQVLNEIPQSVILITSQFAAAILD